MPTVGRNDPCLCGSGKKYKKCCEAKEQAATHAKIEKQWTAATKEKKATQAAEAQKNPGASTPPSHPDKKTSAPTGRHQTGMAPKFNMSRRTGGS